MSLSYQEVTILSGQNVSSAIDLVRNTIVGVRIPTGFDGGAITIEESNTIAGTYSKINPLGQGAFYTVTAGETLGIPANNAACASFARISCASNVSANRTLTVITRTVE